jgi:hypothetical protein
MVNGTLQPPYHRERDPVPIVQEAGWAPGTVWTGAENRAPAGTRSLARPARSKSLYRLSYPGPRQVSRRIKNDLWNRKMTVYRSKGIKYLR